MAERNSLLEKLPRGSADVWDQSAAGDILTAEFFGAPPAGGLLSYFNGSAWLAKPLKWFNGSAWLVKPLKWFNGTTWTAS